MLKKVIDNYKRLLFNLVLTSPLFLFTGEYAYKLTEKIIIYLYGENPLYVEVIIDYNEYLIFCIFYTYLIILVWFIITGMLYRILKIYIPFVDKNLK